MDRATRTIGALVLGAVAGVAGTLAFSGGRTPGGAVSSEPSSSMPSVTGSDLAPAPPKAEACDPAPVRTLPPRPLSNETLPAFEAGTAVLRIGDGYVFGEDHARAADDKAGVDVVCADISAYLTLRCPSGAVATDVPLGALGIPELASSAAILVGDAPVDLPERYATLSLRTAAPKIGVPLVKARGGKTYKVWLLEIRPDPEVLGRLVRVGYAEVPSKAGGGVLRVPTALPSSATTQVDVERIVAAGRDVPGDSFANFVGGPYLRPSELPTDFVVETESRLLLADPLSTSISLPRGGGIWADRGVATGGKLTYGGYTGVVVKGDLAGTVTGDSYGHLHITGSLTGTVEANSYTTVVIDGDLVGTLKIRSYATVVLRGRLLGKIDPSGSCWSTLYLQGFWSRASVEAIEGSFSQFTLHVQSSEMPVGKVEGKVGPWREVIVADPVWKKLAR